MERTTAMLAGLTLALILARPATAQIAWDTPRLIGPESPSGIGFYWMRAETLPGDHNAVIGSWSLPRTRGAVSVRGGIGTGVAEENAVFGGVDLRAPIARHSATQPLDLEWSGGAGVGVGEYLLASVPVAVSAGRSWASGSVWFAPYVSVGATFDYRYGDSDFVPDEEFEIQATAGVGVDLAFDAARRFVVRAAAALGERQAVAVGFVIGG
jgi:hypothetical protein